MFFKKSLNNGLIHNECENAVNDILVLRNVTTEGNVKIRESPEDGATGE